MKREQILATIQRHLEPTGTEPGTVWSVGAIADRVRQDWSREHGQAATHQGPEIPVSLVAEFVDGSISPEEARRVADAAVRDDRVLEELIAAVRALHQPSPPLTPDLVRRLQTVSLPERVSRPTQLSSEAYAGESNASTPPSSVSSSVVLRARAWSPEHLLARAGAGGLGIVLALALAIWFSLRGEPPTTDLTHQTVRQWSQDVESPQSDAISVNPHTPRDAGSDEPDRPHPPQIATNSQSTGSQQSPVAPASRVTAADDPIETGTELPPELPDVEVYPLWKAFRWRDIVGLGVTAKHPASSVVPRQPEIWESLPLDAGDWSAFEAFQSLAVRTLPYSRVEAELSDGARLVLEGNARVQLQLQGTRQPPRLALHHGTMALVDVEEGTVLEVQSERESFGTLRWQSRASLVMRRTGSGVTLEIPAGIIEVDGEPHSQRMVRLTPDAPPVTAGTSNALPRWVRRSRRSVPVSRAVLTRLQRSSDVATALEQQIRLLSQKANANDEDASDLAMLARWRVALADAHLLRLANSRVPALRLAALERLVVLPPEDPRYAETWRVVDRTIDDPARIARIQLLCGLVRRGEKPNPSQIDSLLRGLQTNHVASRALADYLLRRFLSGGPPFDPTWTGRNQARAVRLWYQYTGRNSSPSPNASSVVP